MDIYTDLSVEMLPALAYGGFASTHIMTFAEKKTEIRRIVAAVCLQDM